MRIVALVAIGLLAACRQADPADRNESPDTSLTPTLVENSAPASRESALKLMRDRHENMEDIGDATKAVSRALKSSAPDLAVVRGAAATYGRLAPQVSSWFPSGTGPDIGKTDALPAIWENPEDFTQKARDFRAAVTAFEAASSSGDLAAIKAAFADIGKSCKACHDRYRAKDDD